MEDTHITLWQSETWESAHEKAWINWVNETQKILGHDLDGNGPTDGYSFDEAYDMWEAGWTPADAAAKFEASKAKLKES